MDLKPKNDEPTDLELLFCELVARENTVTYGEDGITIYFESGYGLTFDAKGKWHLA